MRHHERLFAGVIVPKQWSIIGASGQSTEPWYRYDVNTIIALSMAYWSPVAVIRWLILFLSAMLCIGKQAEFFRFHAVKGNRLLLRSSYNRQRNKNTCVQALASQAKFLATSDLDHGHHRMHMGFFLHWDRQWLCVIQCNSC